MQAKTEAALVRLQVIRRGPHKFGVLQLLLTISANSGGEPQQKILSTEDLRRNHFTVFPRKDTIFSKGGVRQRCFLPDTQPLVGVVPAVAL